MLPFPPSSSFRAEGEESRYAKHMREMLLNTSQREGAAGGKGEGNRLPAAGRFQLDTFGFISRNCITMISGLRPLSPFGACGTTFPPQKRGTQQPVLFLEPLMNTKVRGALLSHRLRGEGGGDSHQRGDAAERRHLYWRRKAPYLPSGAVLYNYPGRSPQTVRKAEPIPDRTLGAQGRRPGGCLNPRPEGPSTFGNTAKRRHLSPKPLTSNIAHSKKALTISH